MEEDKKGLVTIIAGPRGFFSYATLLKAIDALPWRIIEVVSGRAKGVDTLGERWARENKIPLKVFPADWKTYGKAAGGIRNKEMAEYADALLALQYSPLLEGYGIGTANMIEIATQKHLEVYVHPIKE